MAHKVRLALKARLVLKVSKASKEIPVQLAPLVQPGRKVMSAQLAHKASKAFRVFRAFRGRLVQQAHRESKAIQAQLVPKVFRAM